MKPSVLLLVAGMLASPVAWAEDSMVSISVAIPSEGGERRVAYGDVTSHFHVVATNISDKPLRIWREWCSWGYYGLSFEVTDEAGKKWTVKKKPRAWSINFPSWCDLEPHESLVIEVDFAKPDTWEGFPKPANGTQKIALRAFFEFKPDEELRKEGVWTGRSEAKPLDVVFAHWKAEKKGK